MIQLNHFRLAAIFAVLSCFCAVQHARAELPPSAYAQMKANASDVVEIEVTRVAFNRREREGLRDISVYADAKIIALTRSKSRLKIGDMISLRYITFEIIRPGWAGPGPIKTVQRGKRYRAWLKKSGSYFYAAAKGQSLEEK